MNYAKIEDLEYVNGKGIGISLFVSGCHFHCEGCFNKEAWDFGYGKLWDDKAKEYFYSLIVEQYEFISRVSILGGEPLADENAFEILQVIKEIQRGYSKCKIWLFTGYTVEEVAKTAKVCNARKMCLLNADYVVDGRFDITQRDLTLPFRGSRNQRILTHKQVEEIFERHED